MSTAIGLTTEEEQSGRKADIALDDDDDDSPHKHVCDGSPDLLSPPDTVAARFYSLAHGSVQDLERKCTLLLAWFRRYPYFRTPCLRFLSLPLFPHILCSCV